MTLSLSCRSHLNNQGRRCQYDLPPLYGFIRSCACLACAFRSWWLGGGVGRLISIGALLLGLITFGSILLHQFQEALKETFENPQLGVARLSNVGLMLLSAL